jgi:hypothetical protein
MISLCVRASVQSFLGNPEHFIRSRRLITFESPLDSTAGFRQGSSLVLRQLTYLVDPENRNCALIGRSLMNFARSTLIQYCGVFDADLRIESRIEEFAGFASCMPNCGLLGVPSRRGFE